MNSNSIEMRPNKSEKLFLNLGYKRFYDLFDEIMSEEFWEKEEWYRFSKISNCFSVYSELLSYEPFKYVIAGLKNTRPPMEAEIGSSMFKFIRNILAHFPFFEKWDDVWVNKDLVNWQKEGLTIDRFFKKYVGYKEIKYRFWEADIKEMSYVSINFPQEYGQNKIFLKDIITEKDGLKFSLIMMRNILNTQVEVEEDSI